MTVLRLHNTNTGEVFTLARDNHLEAHGSELVLVGPDDEGTVLGPIDCNPRWVLEGHPDPAQPRASVIVEITGRGGRPTMQGATLIEGQAWEYRAGDGDTIRLHVERVTA